MIKSVYEGFFKDQLGFDLAIKEFGLQPEVNGDAYRMFFPDKRILSTSFKAIVGGKNKVVAASIIGWNGSSPLTGDETLASVPIENLVISRGKRRTEKELMDIDLAKTVGDNTILAAEFYDDVTFARGSVNLAKYAMVAQLLSDGKVTVTNTNNEGGIDGVVLNYGLTADQKKNASVSWATSATAKPIDDIETILDAGNESGDVYKYMMMSRQTFITFSKTAQMQASVLNIPLTKGKGGEFATQRLGLEDVNAYLLGKGLPMVVIVEDKVRMSKADGTNSLVTVWKANIVHFATDLVQGTFNYNVPLEESKPEYANDAYISNLDKVTIIQKYTTNPPTQETIGKAIGAPAWEGSGSVVLLDTVQA